MANLQIPAK